MAQEGEVQLREAVEALLAKERQLARLQLLLSLQSGADEQPTRIEPPYFADQPAGLSAKVQSLSHGDSKPGNGAAGADGSPAIVLVDSGATPSRAGAWRPLPPLLLESVIQRVCSSPLSITDIPAAAVHEEEMPVDACIRTNRLPLPPLLEAALKERALGKNGLIVSSLGLTDSMLAEQITNLSKSLLVAAPVPNAGASGYDLGSDVLGSASLRASVPIPAALTAPSVPLPSSTPILAPVPLHVIDLSWNDMKRRSASAVVEFCSKFNSLRAVAVEGNSFGGPAELVALMRVVMRLPALRHLGITLDEKTELLLAYIHASRAVVETEAPAAGARASGGGSASARRVTPAAVKGAPSTTSGRQATGLSTLFVGGVGGGASSASAGAAVAASQLQVVSPSAILFTLLRKHRGLLSLSLQGSALPRQALCTLFAAFTPPVIMNSAASKPVDTALSAHPAPDTRSRSRGRSTAAATGAGTAAAAKRLATDRSAVPPPVPSSGRAPAGSGAEVVQSYVGWRPLQALDLSLTGIGALSLLDLSVALCPHEAPSEVALLAMKQFLVLGGDGRDVPQLATTAAGEAGAASAGMPATARSTTAAARSTSARPSRAASARRGDSKKPGASGAPNAPISEPSVGASVLESLNDEPGMLPAAVLAKCLPGALSGLRVLSLARCRLTTAALAAVWDALARHTYCLQALDLSGNSIDDEGAAQLATALTANANRVGRASGSSVELSAAFVLAAGAASPLRVIDVTGNPLYAGARGGGTTQPGCAALVNALAVCPQLLSLSGPCHSISGVLALDDALGRGSSLGAVRASSPPTGFSRRTGAQAALASEPAAFDAMLDVAAIARRTAAVAAGVSPSLLHLPTPLLSTAVRISQQRCLTWQRAHMVRDAHSASLAEARGVAVWTAPAPPPGRVIPIEHYTRTDFEGALPRIGVVPLTLDECGTRLMSVALPMLPGELLLFEWRATIVADISCASGVATRLLAASARAAQQATVNSAPSEALAPRVAAGFAVDGDAAQHAACELVAAQYAWTLVVPLTPNAQYVVALHQRGHTDRMAARAEALATVRGSSDDDGSGALGSVGATSRFARVAAPVWSGCPDPSRVQLLTSTARAELGASRGVGSGGAGIEESATIGNSSSATASARHAARWPTLWFSALLPTHLASHAGSGLETALHLTLRMNSSAPAIDAARASSRLLQAVAHVQTAELVVPVQAQQLLAAGPAVHALFERQDADSISFSFA